MSSSSNDRARPRDERAADHQIVDALRQRAFDPACPEWRQLVRALVELAFPVLVAWGVTGNLRQQAAFCGCRSAARVPATLRLDEDEARALATEVLTVAAERFRRESLMGWDPAGRTSLRTCFVHCCLRELPDAYLQWQQPTETAPTGTEPAVTEPAGTEPGGTEPAGSEPTQAHAESLGDRWLDDDPVLRTVFELQQSGYKLTEIVEVLRSADAPVTPADLRSRIDGAPEPTEEPDG